MIEVERAQTVRLEDKRHIVPYAWEKPSARPKDIGASIGGHLGRELIVRIDIDHCRVIVCRPQDLRDLCLLQIKPKADRVFGRTLPRSAQVFCRRASRRVQKARTVGPYHARHIGDGSIRSDEGVSFDVRIVTIQR